MGLVLALGILYTALEWTSTKKDNEDENTSLNIADMEDALIINEQQQEQPEPEPEAPQEVVEVALPEEFKVVDDNKEVAKISIVSADQDRELPPPPVIVQPVQTVEEPEDQIFEIVENPAVPPTGDIPSLLKWIASHIEYPQSALDNGIQGKVVLRFVVEKDGSIGDILVARKVDPALDKEAVRVLKSMPKWTPGKQRGKPVRSYFTLPISFTIG